LTERTDELLRHDAGDGCDDNNSRDINQFDVAVAIILPGTFDDLGLMLRASASLTASKAAEFRFVYLHSTPPTPPSIPRAFECDGNE
jgi:hypothetical protein